jgi:hypothetical protein
MEPDDALLTALDAAARQQSPIMDRLQTALRFVTLANTDDDQMAENAEAILMGAAFDQLLLGGRKSSAYNLGEEFGRMFREFGVRRCARRCGRRNLRSLRVVPFGGL